MEGRKPQHGVDQFGEAPLLIATLVYNQINRLPDTFLTGIEADVNLGTEKGQSSKIPFEKRKNMES